MATAAVVGLTSGKNMLTSEPSPPSIAPPLGTTNSKVRKTEPELNTKTLALAGSFQTFGKRSLTSTKIATGVKKEEVEEGDESELKAVDKKKRSRPRTTKGRGAVVVKKKKNGMETSSSNAKKPDTVADVFTQESFKNAKKNGGGRSIVASAEVVVSAAKKKSAAGFLDRLKSSPSKSGSEVPKLKNTGNSSGGRGIHLHSPFISIKQIPPYIHITMFQCMPCLKLRSRDVNANVSDITNCMSDISLRATANDNKGKEKEERAEEEDEMSTEWIAEEEQGVLITFISLPNGDNHLKKIRFSEEYFDNREANKWWHDNCERIMSLYSVVYPTQTQQYQSDDELQQIQYNNRLSEERQGSRNIGECSHSNSNDQCGDEGEEQSKEVVVEDCPGVYLHIIELADGTKELTCIQFSREMFGEVKARVWWEENKARLSKLYSSRR